MLQTNTLRMQCMPFNVGPRRWSVIVNFCPMTMNHGSSPSHHTNHNVMKTYASGVQSLHMGPENPGSHSQVCSVANVSLPTELALVSLLALSTAAGGNNDGDALVLWLAALVLALAVAGGVPHTFTQRPCPLHAAYRMVMFAPWHELISHMAPCRPGGHLQVPFVH